MQFEIICTKAAPVRRDGSVGSMSCVALWRISTSARGIPRRWARLNTDWACNPEDAEECVSRVIIHSLPDSSESFDNVQGGKWCNLSAPSPQGHSPCARAPSHTSCAAHSPGAWAEICAINAACQVSTPRRRRRRRTEGKKCRTCPWRGPRGG